MPFLTVYPREESNNSTRYYWECPKCGRKYEAADFDTSRDYELHLLEHIAAPNADLREDIVLKLDDICIACGLHKDKHCGPDGPHPDDCKRRGSKLWG